MKRILSLGCLFAALISPPASAIWDTQPNGMSDLWERAQNGGDLFTNMLPGDDDDNDGWTNEVEAAAGTNPKSSLAPDGFIRPEVSILHDVPFDFDENGIIESNADVATIAWPVIAGKIYTLLHSANLAEGSWEVVTKNLSEANGVRTCHALVTTTGGVPPTDPKMFWRIKIEDVDSDGDGLTNAEEHELGTDTSLADSDSDGLNDLDEILQGTDPNNADTDGDGSSDGNEVKSGHDPNSNQSYPPTWVHTQRHSFHGMPYIQSSSIWDNYYCVNHSWDPLNSSPETCANLLAADCPFPIQPPDNNSHCAYDNGYAPHLVESSGNRPHPGYSTQLTQSRFWLKTKPAPEADMNSKVLRVTQRKILGANYSVTMLPPVIEPLDVIIRAGHIFSEPIDAVPTFTQTLQSNDQEIVVTSVVPVNISDNTPATGVDDVSVTAPTTDAGYQENFWIMAPSGNASNGSACSNAMIFRIPFNPEMVMEISYPQGAAAPATPTPGTVTLGSTGADCAWHGQSSTTTETPATVWKIGTSGQTKTAVDLPIAIKTMKHRTVKLAAYRVAELRSNGTIVPPDSYMVPTKAQLEQYLNELFAYQINTWWQVEFLPATVSVNYGGDGVLNLGSDTEHSADQTAVVNAFGGLKSDSDVHLFLLGASSLVVQQAKGFTCTGKATSWVFASSSGGSYNDTKDLMITISHELGHVFFGLGHPDDNPPFRGPAPLEGTDRKKRLMFSGNDSDSRLIVKKEWDKAEDWLSNRPNGDN